MTANEVNRLVAIAYPDSADATATGADRNASDLSAPTQTPCIDVLDSVRDLAADAGVALAERVLVTSGRWRSYDCTDDVCCPPEGRLLPARTTAFQAAATFAGTTVAATRDDLARQLEPYPSHEDLTPLITEQEAREITAITNGTSSRYRSTAVRAVFAAARASARMDWARPSPTDAARYGAVLRTVSVRDAVWLAVDAGRLDGQRLWSELARSLPVPYRATPAFLVGWQAWRRGDGATARIACDQALAADPEYSAAALLMSALDNGLDPRTVPRLSNRPERTSPSI